MTDLHDRIVGTIQQSEKQFMQAVIQYAKLCRWSCYHTHDSRRSEPGFPDLVLVRDTRTIFAELKTEKGRVSPAQQRWLGLLTVAGHEVYVWRPSDWPAIERALAT